MSLPLRILGALALLLVIALAGGAALLFHHSRALVDVEVRAAFQGAEQSVRDTLRSDVEHTVTLRQVVASFHGQRHVKAALVNEAGKVIVQSELGQAADPAPDWFRRLMAPPSFTTRIPINLRRYPCVVVLTSDPSNEMAEVWDHARDAFSIMALFCAATLAVMQLAIVSAQRFFRRFQEGLLAISDGGYDTRLKTQGPPEFARLARGFNHMAEELSSFSRTNRQLYAQLQTVQEEERAGIARDLHDEVGPYLFAIQVDAKALRDTNAPAASRLSQSIREAAGHIQEHVRGILRQLRPVTRLEFGLEAAIDDLIAFWMRRYPKIKFERVIALPASLDRRSEEAAFRIVQESLNNAVRHGKPTIIRVALRADGDDLAVLVEDDGGGLTSNGETGLGLAGMRERIAALKGQFTVTEEPGRGVRITATLPLTREHETA